MYIVFLALKKVKRFVVTSMCTLVWLDMAPYAGAPPNYLTHATFLLGSNLPEEENGN